MKNEQFKVCASSYQNAANLREPLRELNVCAG